MRNYSPQDTKKSYDELDPCIAAELRQKNDAVFKKNQRYTIICLSILVTLICAAAVLLIVFLAIPSMINSTNTSPANNDSFNVKDGILDSKEADTLQPSNKKILGDVIADGNAISPQVHDSVVPMKDANGESVVQGTIPTSSVASPTTDSQPLNSMSLTPPSKSASEPVTYATTSDELPDIVPNITHVNDYKYPYVETDDIHKDCNEYFEHGHRQSGVYEFNVNGNRFRALCLMEADYPWMVLQRRSSGALSFNKSFDEYSEGFGSHAGDHWLGLEKVRYYLDQGYHLQLRIELRGNLCPLCAKGTADGYWWGDWNFAIGPKSESYVLSLSRIIHGNLSSPVNDVFYSLNNGRPFTTFDHDMDTAENRNCAVWRNMGPWWHKDCGYVGLNGVYGINKKTQSGQSWFYHKPASGPNNASETYFIKPQHSRLLLKMGKSSTV